MSIEEIINLLIEYHQETNPDPISEAELEQAWEKGYKESCGCTLCQVIYELSMLERKTEQAG